MFGLNFSSWPAATKPAGTAKTSTVPVDTEKTIPEVSLRSAGSETTNSVPMAADTTTNLHRGLKARHVAMIAIGGALGTGLVVGTGSALAQAGPCPLLVSYSTVGFVVYMVMCALGEMAAWLPIESGFVGHAARFCDPALGFALGYCYFFKYAVLLPNQLTAAAMIIQYWCPPTTVNPGVFIAPFLAVITAINYFGGVESFGEFQFALSSFKMVVILGMIILSAVLALGGGPNHDRTGFRYWDHPGAIKPYLASGALGKFSAIWSTNILAVFAYLGTELLGVTAGEAQNPRKTIPKAVKLTFWRILVFYVLSVFLLGLILPYNSKYLQFGGDAHSTNASASPFVAAFVTAGIPVLPAILNGCFLLFVISAGNSDSYTATRTLYSIAAEGNSFAFLKTTNKQGVPYWALAVSSTFGLLALMCVSSGSEKVFHILVSLVSTFGLLTWITILVSHVCFVRARRAQQVSEKDMAYVSPFGLYGSCGALAFCTLILLSKDFPVFVHGFQAGGFVTGYIGIPLFLSMLVVYKYWKKTAWMAPLEVDLYSGKAEIDREEEAFLEKQQLLTPSRCYRLVSWLF